MSASESAPVVRQEPASGRAGLFAAALALSALGIFGLRAALRSGPSAPTIEERLRADERIDALIYDCGFGKQFDEQTVDMTSTLVSKLERGARDPLRIAKQELARIGPSAVPPMQRVFDRAYQDAYSHGVVENVLAVCSMMEEPAGLELLRLAVRHPQETVRTAALAGIRKHGEAADYDLVLAALALATSSRTQADYAATLDKLDHARFQSDLAQWLEEGSYAETWAYIIDRAADASDPSLVARFRAAADFRDETLRPFLLAPAAASGDEAALGELQRRLHEGLGHEQQVALQALSLIGRAREGIALLSSDNAGVRRKVYSLLVTLGPDEELHSYLEDGVLDSDPGSSELCLEALVARGNAFARAHALQLLEGNAVQRANGMQALRAAWPVLPGAPEEAFQRLMGMYRATAADPGELLGVLQTIAQVPHADAARFLLDLARTASGEVKGREAYRFFVGQVWNTGSAGQDLLRAELATEGDPLRRLALIEFVWQDHSDLSREHLLAIVQDVTQNPYERLYAADRVIRIGPASVIAPILKQVYKETTDVVLRPALQCLLWTWYGQHFE